MATKHDGGLIAVQCKFLAAEPTIRKEDIDSFISASAEPQFSERMIVETTRKPWSSPAETMLQGQAIQTTCIGLQDLVESDVEWAAFAGTGEIARREPKVLRPDQVEALKALKAVRACLGKADRCKLIMACGPGKTLTALRIAEDIAGADRLVLFLMPSLPLMAQSVREWCADAVLALVTFAVCSELQRVSRVSGLRACPPRADLRLDRAQGHTRVATCGHHRSPRSERSPEQRPRTPALLQGARPDSDWALALARLRTTANANKRPRPWQTRGARWPREWPLSM